MAPKTARRPKGAPKAKATPKAKAQSRRSCEHRAVAVFDDGAAHGFLYTSGADPEYLVEGVPRHLAEDVVQLINFSAKHSTCAKTRCGLPWKLDACNVVRPLVWFSFACCCAICVAKAASSGPVVPAGAPCMMLAWRGGASSCNRLVVVPYAGVLLQRPEGKDQSHRLAALGPI